MKYLFLITSLFIIIGKVAYSQTGTLIIATITDEGIYMAADSRGAIYETSDRSELPLAYYDSSCKIMKLKQFMIGISGPTALNKTYYSEILNQFNKLPFKNIDDIYKTYLKFKSFLDSAYPIASNPSRNRNIFLIAGYEKGKPKLLGIKSSNMIVRTEGSIISDNAAQKYVLQNNSDYRIPMTTRFEKTISDFAKFENKTYLVGGPVTVINISPDNKIKWIQNDFSKKNFSFNYQFINAILADKVKMVYLVADGKNRVLKVLNFYQISQKPG